MAISIDWGTRIIYIPKADLDPVTGTGSLYDLDTDDFRLALKDLEDSEAGMPFPDTHLHNTEVTVCLLYTSPSPRDRTRSRMPSSA